MMSFRRMMANFLIFKSEKDICQVRIRQGKGFGGEKA